MIAALRAGSPPASASVSARGRPTSSGATVSRVTPSGRHVVDDAAAVERQLVDALAVHHERPLRAERAQHVRDAAGGLRVCHANQLAPCARRVGERAAQVERGADSKLAAGRSGVPHAGMEVRRVEKAEAVLAQGSCGLVD